MTAEVVTRAQSTVIPLTRDDAKNLQQFLTIRDTPNSIIAFFSSMREQGQIYNFSFLGAKLSALSRDALGAGGQHEAAARADQMSHLFTTGMAAQSLFSFLAHPELFEGGFSAVVEGLAAAKDALSLTNSAIAFSGAEVSVETLQGISYAAMATNTLYNAFGIGDNVRTIRKQNKIMEACVEQLATVDLTIEGVRQLREEVGRIAKGSSDTPVSLTDSSQKMAAALWQCAKERREFVVCDKDKNPLLKGLKGNEMRPNVFGLIAAYENAALKKADRQRNCVQKVIGLALGILGFGAVIALAPVAMAAVVSALAFIAVCWSTYSIWKKKANPECTVEAHRCPDPSLEVSFPKSVVVAA